MGNNEIVNKLKAIHEKYSTVCKIKSKIAATKAPDNYQRKITVPEKPVKPQEVSHPQDNKMTLKEYLNKNVFYFVKLPIGFGIASVFIFFVHLMSKDMSASSLADDAASINTLQKGVASFYAILSAIFLGLCALFLLLNLVKRIKGVKSYAQYVAIEQNKYDAQLHKYQEYQAKEADYLKQYESYQAKLKASEEEEKSFAKIVENDSEALRKVIRENELEPAQKMLDAENDGYINSAYYNDIPRIIALFEMGRADTLKEALNLLATIKEQERQQQLAEQRRQEALEREMLQREEDLAREERYRQEELERERRRELDRKRKEQMEERQRQKEESDRHAQAIAQCSICQVKGCPNYAKQPNCPNFKGRSLF